MLREGQPLRLADIRADPRFEGWPAAHPELSDVLAVPIKDGSQPPGGRAQGGRAQGGRVLGFIFAACKRGPGGFTERDERLVGLFAAHAAIALSNARLYERGRELSVLQERARLARELHDAVSQKLFSVRAKATAAAVLVERDPDRAVAEIRSVAELAGQAHAELRAVIDGLAPPDLAAGGLAGSLRGYARLAGTSYGVAVRVVAGDLPAARRRAGGGGVPGRAGGAAQRAAPLRRRRGPGQPDRAPGPGDPGGGRRRPGLRGQGPARRPGPGVHARAGRRHRRQPGHPIRPRPGHHESG